MFAAARTSAAAQSGGAMAARNLLRVLVVGLRNDDGDLCCSLFSSAEDFPNNHDLLAVTVTSRIREGAATCEFPGTQPGTYAIVVFHDENGDGKFNRDWLGLPQEGYGFSNDAPTHLHAPSFDAASFAFTENSPELLIHIRY